MNLGGPVWHASGRGSNRRQSLALALSAITGVGDKSLGEWREDGANGVVHVRRRLSEAEAREYGLVVRDLRGSVEEEARLEIVYSEMPHLRGLRIG